MFKLLNYLISTMDKGNPNTAPMALRLNLAQATQPRTC